ncbi:hypothetical protein [Aquicoccus sp.]|uniref:hypothetical protein n=1 Tax=Aquicoccus sp. TaxID=2055851 RepID=UPI003561974D
MKRAAGFSVTLTRALNGLRPTPLRRLAASNTKARDRALADRLERQLILPAADTPNEERARAAMQDRGQFLARQERWEDLSDEIRAADAARDATPCAMPHAELLSYGARADVVHATEEALADGANPSVAGIEALEEMLAEFPRDHAVAATVALAHADIGWAWRGTGWPHEIPDRNQQLFATHFERAARILEPFFDQKPESPLLAAARCTLLSGDPDPGKRLADDYERLIDLNPGNPRPMRALGNHLLPRWFGSYDALELEARRTAARSGTIWGNGAYAWVYMDALAVDPGAARALDLDFFLDGMRDILANRPDQHIANMLAAYAAITMDPNRTPPDAPRPLRETRLAIHAALDWILAEYLFELHPLVWAEASIGPDLSDARSAQLPMRSALLRRGTMTARMTIARHFADELLAGTTVAFSRHGLRLYPPQ